MIASPFLFLALAVLLVLGLFVLFAMTVWRQKQHKKHIHASLETLLFQAEHLDVAQAAQTVAFERLERTMRAEVADTARLGRSEASAGLAQLQQTVSAHLTGQAGLHSQHIEQITLQLGNFAKENSARLDSVREASQQQAQHARTEQAAALERFRALLQQQLTEISERDHRSLSEMRMTLEQKLKDIEANNAQKLEEMRRTVDEKLHATLEQRLGESFQLVSQRLEQVHRGLGEMHSLAAGVGDLKRVLTNVKTRGTWGEVQLGALLEQILTPEQYAVNVATVPGSSERVEFAIRLPGLNSTGHTSSRRRSAHKAPTEGEKSEPSAKEDALEDDMAIEWEESVWLPIDAKFPSEDYERLLLAQDQADALAVEEASRALEMRIKQESKKIAEKYLSPPHTTDFALLYLPTEGLYAEVLRRPGLSDLLQRTYRITLTGPTTLTALLNSLQMGFRTLAIEKRSSEVWQVLGAVKTEFSKFGDVLSRTKSQLETVTRSIDLAQQRTRVMHKKLRTVEALPEAEAIGVLGVRVDDASADNP